MNELTWMNWNERTETNELKWMICRPHLQKVVRTCQFVSAFFIWNWAFATVSCTFCRPHRQKVLRTCQFFAISMWNRALATVSCTFCRPHFQKVVRTCQFFGDFHVSILSEVWLLNFLRQLHLHHYMTLHYTNYVTLRYAPLQCTALHYMNTTRTTATVLHTTLH